MKRVILTTRRRGSSETDFVDVRVPPVSGQYIRLDKQGSLALLDRLWKERMKWEDELAQVEKALQNCNNRAWLLQFHTQMRRQGRKFGSALVQHVNELERRKTRLVDRLAQNGRQVRKIDPSLFDSPPPVPESTIKNLPTPRSVSPNPHSNPTALARDFTIRKYGHLSNWQICEKLDAELMRSDAPPLGLPESWQEKYAVRSYCDSFRHNRCKNMVQKLIWKAKQRF